MHSTYSNGTEQLSGYLSLTTKKTKEETSLRVKKRGMGRSSGPEGRSGRGLRGRKQAGWPTGQNREEEFSIFFLFQNVFQNHFKSNLNHFEF